MKRWKQLISAPHSKQERNDMTKDRKATVGLYWVTTCDHDEDWFILAKNSRSATRFHEIYEGYDPGDATARKVLGGIQLKDGDNVPRHAQIEDLEPLGFKVLQEDPTRIVRLRGRTFREGQLQVAVEAAYKIIEAENEKQLASRQDLPNKPHLVD